MRYSIRLSYDGTGLSGWQIQPNGLSVQESLQNALSTALGENVQVTGAGRTDAGVNAVNYVAHFDVERQPVSEPGALVCKLNAILKKEITVHAISPEEESFHARFSAVSREYRYFIHRKKDPFIGKFSWQCGYRLDVEAMNEAASCLPGTRDFSCFEKKGGNNRTSVCTVYEAGWKNYLPSHAKVLDYPAAAEDYLFFTVRADRFLRNMVRAIVGSLIDVGRGKRDVQWFRDLLENGTRSEAGESVPGHALFLKEIGY